MNIFIFLNTFPVVLSTTTFHNFHSDFSADGCLASRQTGSFSSFTRLAACYPFTFRLFYFDFPLQHLLEMIKPIALRMKFSTTLFGENSSNQHLIITSPWHGTLGFVIFHLLFCSFFFRITYDHSVDYDEGCWGFRDQLPRKKNHHHHHPLHLTKVFFS